MTDDVTPVRALIPRTSRAGPTPALAVLFAAAFVVGTAELVVVGLLTRVAEDLDVSVGGAGLLVTSYALGIAIGGPLLTAATFTLPRRAMLAAAFAVYLAGTLVAAAAPSFGALLAARAVTGALHGLFVGVALAVASAMVAPERRGRALALVLGGIATSTALGLPLGTFLGQQFGWRAAFVAVAAAGGLVLLGLGLAVPSVARAGSSRLRTQVRDALAPRVLAVLACAFLVMGGQFVALTFLTPFLEEVTGLSDSAVTAYLLLYGLAAAAGTVLGGRGADANANVSLVAGAGLVVLSLAAVWLVGDQPVLLAIALAVWGFAGWGLVPSLQSRTMDLAGAGRELAATLPASATTGGIALGAIAGGAALERSGPAAPPLLAAVLCLAVVPLLVLSSRLKLPSPAEPDRAVGMDAVADAGLA